MGRELAFIEALRALASDPAARGLTDDCAVLPFGSETLVLTHDTMVAGVHFLPDQDPADVAWKLVATNMSDLAAKGAVPMGVLLSYQLAGTEERFLAGLAEALDEYGARLLGGDTVSSSGPQVLGLTAIGRASYLPVPGRDGAQVGDLVYITGPIGGAMVGLEALREKGPAKSSLAYRRPLARIAEGQALAPFVTAMMDVSDGLLLDASRIAKASKVTINLESAAIPLACPPERRDEALRWGDDYQLLLTAPPELALPLPMHRIGVVGKRQEAPVLINGAVPLGSLGYQH
ncbi:thiamine-phosphate kinase [Novosphingobium sediminicola]|uniref:Thiamine-monophosphate kinase n=1 Tax=Novosphingobium sediminicola TaxID=563162 RepID=A0A7W6CR47_9SPHN|nr:thiamine-phosphate kinase [Novosphingobium sediminicola]MBB3956152.1 thiamine-monophosphate kinase [Novosphingobium sediminicola]